MRNKRSKRQIKMMLQRSNSAKPILPINPKNSKNKSDQESYTNLNKSKVDKNNQDKTNGTDIIKSNIEHDKSLLENSSNDKGKSEKEDKKAKDGDSSTKPSTIEALPSKSSFINYVEGQVYRSNIKITSLSDKLSNFIAYHLLIIRSNLQKENDFIPISTIVHGPRGNGKTFLIHAIAGELNLPILTIDEPTLIYSKLSIERMMSHIFDYAKRLAPCILHINQFDLDVDETDSVFKNARKSDIINYFNKNNNEICKGYNIFIFIEAVSYALIDQSLKDRIKYSIPLGIPNENGRLKILENMVEHFMLASDVDLKQIAFQTPGLVAGDLKRAFATAYQRSIYRKMQICKPPNYAKFFNQLQSQEVLITMEDIDNILEDLVPSALDRGYASVPKISWSEVGALDEVKKVLKDRILRQVELVGQSEDNMMDSSGILLCGPPGTGKTMIAMALAKEAGLNFIAVKGPELLNMYFGESERMLVQCFERAQNSAPCVLFFDEIDTLCPARKDDRNDASSRLVATMLSQISGLTSRMQVYLVATTNRPGCLDPALLRAGRFSVQLYVGLPNPQERLQILQAIFSTRPHLQGPDLDLKAVADRCINYSGSDLHELVNQALNILIVSCSNLSDLQPADFQLSNLHFEAALHLTRASIPERDLAYYDQLALELRQGISFDSKKASIRKRKREGDDWPVVRKSKISASNPSEEEDATKDSGSATTCQDAVDDSSEQPESAHFAKIFTQLVAHSRAIQPTGSPVDQDVEMAEESQLTKFLAHQENQDVKAYNALIPNQPPPHKLHLFDEKKLVEASIQVSCGLYTTFTNKTILVHGPEGTGKATFIRLLGTLNKVGVVEEDTSTLGPNFNELNCFKKLRKCYEKALALAPCILFLNQLDYFKGSQLKILLTGLVSLIERLDTLDKDKKVVIAMSAKSLSSLTSTLLYACPHRVSQQHPREDQRQRILESLNSTANVDFKQLSQELPGATYSNLVHISDLAAGPIKKGDMSTLEDYREVLSIPSLNISSSSQQQPDKPKLSWDCVGGMDHIKDTLKLEILTRVKHRRVFERLGMTGSSGILLCGPPGTGKTLVASAVACEAGLNFIPIKGPELLNMYVGESERNIRECFAKARSLAPCIICFDEIDSLCMRRQSSDEVMTRVVGTLLSELNGLHPRDQVFVVATTNRYDSLDPAVLRTGRLGIHLYVDLPTQDERAQILKVILDSHPTVKPGNDVDFQKIASSEKCSYFTGADLNELVKAVVRKQRDISNTVPLLLFHSHFEEALESLRPSLSLENLMHYERIRQLLDKDMETRRKLSEIISLK